MPNFSTIYGTDNKYPHKYTFQLQIRIQVPVLIIQTIRYYSLTYSLYLSNVPDLCSLGHLHLHHEATHPLLQISIDNFYSQELPYCHCKGCRSGSDQLEIQCLSSQCRYQPTLHQLSAASCQDTCVNQRGSGQYLE